MAVKACLNGGRTRAEHPAIPQSPTELAADALAVRKAGAEPVPSVGNDRTGAMESHGAMEQKKGEGRERVLDHGRKRTESGGKTDGAP